MTNLENADLLFQFIERFRNFCLINFEVFIQSSETFKESLKKRRLETEKNQTKNGLWFWK